MLWDMEVLGVWTRYQVAVVGEMGEVSLHAIAAAYTVGAVASTICLLALLVSGICLCA
jgi:hypothetical protein